ncbi:MAG: dockerin type I domain-containing protein [Phycisphaerae bacterium]
MFRPIEFSIPLRIVVCVCLASSAGATPPSFPGADLLSRDGDVQAVRLDAPAVGAHFEPQPSFGLRSRQIAGTSLLSAGAIPEGDTPIDVDFTPDGARIVVAHRDSRNLIVYSAATRAFLAAVPLSGSPQALAISSDGVHAITANIWEDTASIVDLSTYAETAVIPVGDQPGTARVTPNGALGIIGNMRSGSLSIINLTTATETRRIAGVGFVNSAWINFEAGVVVPYFNPVECANDTIVINADYYADRIRFVDIASGSITAVVSNPAPRGIAVVPGGATAFVSHGAASQSVSVLNVPTRTITATHAIGLDLAGPIACDAAGTRVLVAGFNVCRMLTLPAGTVSADIAAATQWLGATADGNFALCAGARGSLVSFATGAVVKDYALPLLTNLGGVAPIGSRGALISYVFSEDLNVVTTSGAASIVEGTQPSGPAPEADKTRTVAVSADGTKAVTTNILSDTASIVTLPAGTVDAVVAVGDRPSEVAITPDGSKAVVANLDSTFASIISLSTHAVSNVPISTRAAQVEISPDGHYAYLSVVSGGDGVWRIDLNTASVTGAKLLTGDMGSAGFAFQQSSGLTLSHDGATLATCDSFTDTITIIDTASWSIAQLVTVGDFPVRAVFSADDQTIYVSNKNDDTIRVVHKSAGVWAAGASIPVGDQPFEMALSADGNTLYVANFGAPTSIGVVNLSSGTMTTTIPTPNFPLGLHLDPSGESLHVASGNWTASFGPGPAFAFDAFGEYLVIDTATNAIVDQATTGQPAGMLAFDDITPRAVMSAPLVDSLSVVDFVPVCVGDVNGDNVVNEADLGVLLAHWQASVPPNTAGDLDGDGVVNESDLGTLLANWLNTCL